MNATSPITCRSSSSWELLEWTVELATKAANRVWTWQECREESGVAALITVFCGINKFLNMKAAERAARPSSRLVAASCTAASVAAWLEIAAGREADQNGAATLLAASQLLTSQFVGPAQGLAKEFAVDLQEICVQAVKDEKM